MQILGDLLAGVVKRPEQELRGCIVVNSGRVQQL
jgi:hypothetical protein